MSDFDSNPFGDPFSGREITTARNNPRMNDPVDDFNPFANDQFTPAVEPAVLTTQTDVPPYPGPSASNSATVAAATEELKRRQEELDRKALDIERRERDIQRTVQTTARANNFPPLPSICPVRPCFYQDISLDIPAEFQRTVKIAFYTWIAYSLLLFLNIIACLTYFIGSASKGSTSCDNQSGVSFGLSILYFCLWVPLSFVCWFRPAYNAFRNDSSFYFFTFFFVFFIQSCVCVIQCLGIDGSGTVGYLSGIGMVGCNSGIAAFMLIIGGLFTALAVICFLLLLRIHRFYRSSGASFSKAQQEFAQGVITNPTVMQATAGAVSSSINSTINSSATNQYSGNYDNRY